MTKKKTTPGLSDAENVWTYLDKKQKRQKQKEWMEKNVLTKKRPIQKKSDSSPRQLGTKEVNQNEG